MPSGREHVIDVDLGDVTLHFAIRVKGLHLPRFAWHVGVPTPTATTDRVINHTAFRGRVKGKVDLVMDLLDDQKVPLSLQWTDDVGNPVAAPDGATTTYSIDDPSIINLTDNGDGTAEAAATGTLGSATVHVDVTNGDQTLSGDLALVVVASAADRVTIAAGTPEHV